MNRIIDLEAAHLTLHHVKTLIDHGAALDALIAEQKGGVPHDSHMGKAV